MTSPLIDPEQFFTSQFILYKQLYPILSPDFLTPFFIYSMKRVVRINQRITIND